MNFFICQEMLRFDAVLFLAVFWFLPWRTATLLWLHVALHYLLAVARFATAFVMYCQIVVAALDIELVRLLLNQVEPEHMRQQMGRPAHISCILQVFHL